MTGAELNFESTRVLTYVSGCEGPACATAVLTDRRYFWLQVEKMLRGEAWDLFQSIAQRSEIAASALSQHALYDGVSARLGKDERFKVPYVVSVLQRMDRCIREWECARRMGAQFTLAQIQNFVALVREAHDHVNRFRKEAAPALEKLQLAALAPEQENDVQHVLSGMFDSARGDFKGSGLFTPLARILQQLQFQITLREPSVSDSVGGTGDAAGAPPPSV